MMGGMARVVSYDTPRDPNGRVSSKKLLKKQINGILGMIDVASHTTGFNLITSNIRNQFNAL
jgi:hypothetical protein